MARDLGTAGRLEQHLRGSRPAPVSRRARGSCRDGLRRLRPPLPPAHLCRPYRRSREYRPPRREKRPALPRPDTGRRRANRAGAAWPPRGCCLRAGRAGNDRAAASAQPGGPGARADALVQHEQPVPVPSQPPVEGPMPLRESVAGKTLRHGHAGPAAAQDTVGETAALWAAKPLGVPENFPEPQPFREAGAELSAGLG